MRRPKTLTEAAITYERACADASSPAETRSLWMAHAGGSLVRAGAEIGVTATAIRAATLTMVEASVRLTARASDACAEHSAFEEPGVLSMTVTGSVARDEAVPGSDIDFNVLLTAEAIDSLRTSSLLKARTAREVLRDLERELRKRVLHDDLLTKLRIGGYEGTDRLTMKPLSTETLVVDETDPRARAVAISHLINLVFGVTPVSGGDRFDELLDQTLGDSLAVAAAVMGRLALVHAWYENPESMLSRADRESGGPAAVLKQAHAVASCSAAVLAAGFVDGDPQMPYWATLNVVPVAALDAPVRATFERYFAAVATARGGTSADATEAVADLIDAVFSGLPLAIDAILDRLGRQGASDDVIDAWEGVLDLTTQRDRLVSLARDMGLPVG
jgi:predicted nucleotidyltransferase